MTLIWPDWIELVFGVDPDGGSGQLEWWIVDLAEVASVLGSVLARLEWRRVAVPAASLTE